MSVLFSQGETTCTHIHTKPEKYHLFITMLCLYRAVADQWPNGRLSIETRLIQSDPR